MTSHSKGPQVFTLTSTTFSRLRGTPARAVLMALVLCSLAAPSVAGAAPARGADILNGAWSVWPSWSNKTTSSYHKLGVAYPNAIVEVLCWHDGGRVHYNGQGSSRWFLIFYQNAGTPVIGFVTTLAIDPAKQPRVPLCVRRPDWPQKWGPPGTDGPPQEAIVYQPGPDDSTPPPDPGTGPAGTPPASDPPPPQTHPETAGGVAHTWTNYTNAGGYAGPTIASNQTVQIACKLPGFRVQDGNTWWYRIAQAPWNGAYYVSADAFYNNGQTWGSLIGTPFMDPAVRDC